MESFEQSPLYQVMHPGSVAVVGASNSMLTMGTLLLNNLLNLGFEGKVYPVHPTLNHVLGLQAYSSVSRIPEVPDLALIVVPTRVVTQVLRDCGEKGIRRAIIVSAGFRELGDEGFLLEQELLDTARKYGIRFVGPNCIGVIHPAHRFNTTFFHYDASMEGFIGMASQSGSFITQMFYHLNKFGLGFSQGFSVGNQADISITDCVEYLGACPRTKVIGLYIEGLAHPDRLVRVAREVSKKKPIVAMYVGGTEGGRRAARSHTGALAGMDAVYEGAFRQCGVVRAYSIEELFDYCWVLGSQPLPQGNRTMVLTHSGGPGAAAADAAERSGLRIPPLSRRTRNRLRDAVPHTGSLNNPVDLTFTRNFEELYELIPRVLLEDEDSDALLVYVLMSTDNFQRIMDRAESSMFDSLEAFEKYMVGLCHRFAALIKSQPKPVICSSFQRRSELFIRELEDQGIPVLPSPERSARALGALFRYAGMRARLLAGESSREA